MAIFYTVERSDGQRIAGPYQVDTVVTVALVDLPPEGVFSYYLKMWADGGSDGCSEARIEALVVKR